MNLSEDIIQKGSVVIYDDTDISVIGQVNDYNKHMAYCRMKKKQYKHAIEGYTMYNIFIIAGMMLAELIMFAAKTFFFKRPFLTGIVLIMYAVVFFIFRLGKKNLGVSTISSALLLIIDFRLIFLVAGSTVLYIMADRAEKNIKTEPGYPSFLDIHIHYERGKSARYEKYNGDKSS